MLSHKVTTRVLRGHEAAVRLKMLSVRLGSQGVMIVLIPSLKGW